MSVLVDISQLSKEYFVTNTFLLISVLCCLNKNEKERGEKKQGRSPRIT